MEGRLLHPLTVRVTHWINALAIAVMIAQTAPCARAMW